MKNEKPFCARADSPSLQVDQTGKAFPNYPCAHD